MDVTVPVDGETLHATLHENDAARGTLVLVHGFLSEGREFGDAPERLAGRGWHVAVPDLRGHGRSTGPRGMASEPLAVADVRALVAALKARGSPEPFGVVGHSAGGALAARFLAVVPDLAAGVLVAPMDTLRHEMGGVEFAGYRAARRISLLKARAGLGSLKVPYKYAKRPDALYVDPAAIQRARLQRFIQEWADLAWYDDMIALAGATWARDVTKPTLVVVCDHDRIVQNASSERVFSALKGPKDLVRLDSGHSAFGDRCADDLVEHVDAWFAKHLAPASPTA